MSETDIVQVGPPMPQIGSVEADRDFSIRVTWVGNINTSLPTAIELAPIILTYKFYRPLRDNPELFRTVHIINEGAAIAWALLDFLRERGAYVIATTHYPELKTYAEATSRVQNASVEFDLQTLAATAGFAVTTLVDALAEAEAAPAVTALADGAGRYRFAHALVRETLYDGLPASRRLELHRLAGEALERLHPEVDGEQLTVLAHHFLRAAPLAPVLAERGARYAARAAEHG